MQLSTNFTLDELTTTKHKDMEGFQKNPPANVIANLKKLANDVLQPIRLQFGPIKVNSGWRSPQLNAKVGGAKGSYHLTGEAADIVPLNAKIEVVFDWIARSSIPFGELIHEYPGTSKSWIHITTGTKREIMTFDGKSYKKWVPLSVVRH